jgi:hypothetical protein
MELAEEDTMTERSETYSIPGQLDLFGGIAPPAGLTRDQKCAYIMEHWPETRNDDRLLMIRFWQVFDSLEEILGATGFRRFQAWFAKATHPETIRRGRAEIQKLGKGGGSLLPEEHEAARRRALDGAGPPRGRR